MKISVGCILTLAIALIIANITLMTKTKTIGILQTALEQRDQRLREQAAQLRDLAEQAARFDQILQQREANLSTAREKSAEIREVIRVVREDPDIGACMDMRLPDAAFDGLPVQPAAGSNADRAGISPGTPAEGLRHAADSGADYWPRDRPLDSGAGGFAELQRRQSGAASMAGLRF